MSRIQRHFLGWERPVPETVVAFLARRWTGEGSLDLSDHLVVVPTRQAGRQLREALARHAAERQAAVLPPLTVTPNYLFSPARIESPPLPAASPQAATLLWTALLLRLPLADYRRLYPVAPPEQNLEWAVGNAKELVAVRDLLVESGLDFAAAAEALAEHGIEPGRWQDLAALESAAVALIEGCGLGDPGHASLEAAQSGSLPAHVREIVVASVPDLRPLAATALDRLAGTIPATLLVAAPESEAGAFDDFGRPLADHWLTREIGIASPERTLHPCDTPAAQAERCRELLAAYGDPAPFATIGLPDPDLAPTLVHRLAEAGIPTYDPAGKAVAREGIVHLLRLLHELLVSERFATVAQLLRCPGCAAALAPDREDLRTGWLLRDCDTLAKDHFPSSLGDAIAALRRHPGKAPGLAAILAQIRALVGRLRKGDFAEELRSLLASVLSGKRLHPQDPEASVYTEVADAIHSLQTDLDLSAPAFPRPLRADERLSLLLASLGERRIYPDRSPRDLDLQGWLELLWDDAPHLVVTGMNDHAVPEAVVGHAFLPDSARKLLGVPDNDARFARDAYLLAVLAETRRTGGQLDLLFGRLDAQGNPLRPSRLLFQCPDAELAGRTLRLFDRSDSDHLPAARSVAWQLRPSPLPSDHRIFQRISVTGFKSYLACPFRHYLRNGLGMESVDPGKAELDSMDFGNLVHAALESFGQDDALRLSTDAAEIATGFEAEIDRWLAQRFGPRLSTPLLIQREAALRRLAHWSRIEAAQRAEGWEILEVESALGKDDWPFQIAGMPVHGRIDRIERHPSLGLRVFDFKTLSPMENGRIKTVDSYHLANIRRTDDPAALPEWSRTTDARGKEKRWTDLQIPLYHIALAQRFPGEPVAAGYVTLGRTVEEVRIDLWEGLDEALLDSARLCATGVIESIRQGIFWPPQERQPKWDEFHSLLSPTAEEAVDARGLGRGLDPVSSTFPPREAPPCNSPTK